MSFTITYESLGAASGGEAASVNIDTAYEAWHVAEKLGRSRQTIINIKDPVGHSISLQDLLYRAAREAH